MTSDGSEKRRGSRVLGFLGKLLLHVVLPLAVLVGGYLGARHLMATAPSTAKKPRARSARAVEVVDVVPETAAPRLQAMGLVKPAREVTLRPRVGGEVVAVAPQFEPGGRFAMGEELLRIDRADFDLAVAQAQATLDQVQTARAQAATALAQAQAALDQRKATLAEAEANLQLEEGNQAIARREFEMLGGAGGQANEDLVLRTPQLAIARAVIASARAGIEAAAAGVDAARAGVDAADANVEVAKVKLSQAELDRTRTSLEAPFNAWIRERQVEVGAVIGTTTNVATLVGTDTYWVEVTLPMSDLQWLRIPSATNEGGARVIIRDEAAWGPQGRRTGRLLRLLGDLESAGRLARLLVVVDDPLHLDADVEHRYPLLTGSYVRAELQGRAVDGVVVLDRAWLRHGDRIWAVDDENLLRIRQAVVCWRGREKVFVCAGLEDGDRVITTDLAAPVDGMPVSVRGEEPSAPSASAPGSATEERKP